MPRLPSHAQTVTAELVISARRSPTSVPLPNLTMLEVLELDGVSCCPSLSCLSRLTRLSLTGNPSELTMYTASANILQSIKVCDACSSMFVCKNAFS